MIKTFTKGSFVFAAGLLLFAIRPAGAQTNFPPHVLAPGPFQPTWESLEQGYQCPEWFRDAKFGIWNHWTAQCVPEQGDWYARRMYLQGDKDYDHHLKTYGRWAFAEFTEVFQIAADFKAKVESEFNKMIAKAIS